MNQAAWLWILLVIGVGCGRISRNTSETTSPLTSLEQDPKGEKSEVRVTDPCAAILAARGGTGELDGEIMRLQALVRQSPRPSGYLEQLGWKFVAKARGSVDPTFFTLSEQCALCLELRNPGSAGAKLLRGHVLYSLRRFQEAEVLARALVAQRGQPFDFALLGDVLVERGHLAEAIDAYQKLMDLRPDAEAYARAAHVRWLKGDLEGALEAMLQAAGAAGSPFSSETGSWINCRLAFYLMQSGQLQEAVETCESLLGMRKEYAPALFMAGRLYLVQGKTEEAIKALQRAAEIQPLVETRWMLAEVLRKAGRSNEAEIIETELLRSGALIDPRTFALYLATKGTQVKTAIALARKELEARTDIFTYDTFAWALAAEGQYAEAWENMQRALAEGTEDPRLFFHATEIAAKSNHTREAVDWLAQAMKRSHLLLPSEQERLQTINHALLATAGSETTGTGLDGFPTLTRSSGDDGKE